MKRLFAAFLVTAASVGAATAGNNDALVIPPQAVETPAAQDWGGFYLGGMYGFEAGIWNHFINDVSVGEWDTEGSEYGAFVGYNIQRNNLVFGGELAYALEEVTLTGQSIEVWNDTTIDVKARLGYALDNLLVYGVAGWSLVDHSNNPSFSIDMSGLNYGAGVQTQFGNGMFIGAEYLVRDLAGDHPTDPTRRFEWTKNTIALRAGVQF